MVVEPVGGRLELWDDPAGVLSNEPPFPHQMTNLSRYLNLSAGAAENRFVPGLELDAISRGLGAVGPPSAGAPCPNPAADAASETRPGSLGWPLWVVLGGLGPARPLAWTTKGHRRSLRGGPPRSRRLGQPACECLWLACGSRGHAGPVLGAS